MLRIEAGLPLVDVEWHNSRLAFTDARAGHAQGARHGLDAARRARRRPRLRRPRRDPPRARRRAPRAGPPSGSSSTGRDWDRLHRDAGLLPPQGRAPAALRVDAVRRRDGRQPGRLRHELHATPPSCSATSAWPGCGPSWPRPAPTVHLEIALYHHNTTVRRAHREAAPVQPREEDGPAMTTQRTHATTRSWSAAATTGWSTPATSPRPGCAPWCSSSGTSSAARRSPRSWCPGFSFTTFSYALSLLRPEIIHELDLVEHGFMPLMMPSSFHPTGDGDYLLLGDDHGQNVAGDPAPLAATTPTPTTATTTTSTGSARRSSRCSTTRRPNVFGKDPEDQADVKWLLDHLGGVDRKVMHDVVRLLTGSASDWLEDYFEHEAVKGYHASSSIIGSKVGPMSPGSGLVLLFHKMGEHDGHLGSWAFHKGGNGGFTQVLARAAEAYGAEIRLGAPVSAVLTQEGRTVGVALEDGTELRAPGRGLGARPAAHLPRAGRPARAARRPGRQRRADAVPRRLGEGQLRPRRRCRSSRRCPTPSTTTAASSTSARPSSTSSGPSTPRSTAGTASGPSSTPRSSRSSTRTWPRPASTSCRASCSTRRTSCAAATGRPSASASATRRRRCSSRTSRASATWCCTARWSRPSTSSASPA